MQKEPFNVLKKNKNSQFTKSSSCNIVKGNSTYFNCSLYEEIFYLWVSKFIKFGKQKSFEQNMHYNLRNQESSSQLFQNLKRNLNQPKISFKKALWITFKGKLLMALGLSFLDATLQFTNPWLIYKIISYVENKENSSLDTWFIIATVLAFLAYFIVSVQAPYQFKIIGVMVQNSTNSLIYNKALKFSLFQDQNHSIGSLVNHMEIDSSKLAMMINQIPELIIFPLQLIVTLIVMYIMLGNALIPGLIAFLIMLASNYFTGKYTYKFQDEIMDKKDQRMKLTNEVLAGIRYIKMVGWEDLFSKKISKCRENELSVIKKQLNVITISIFSLCITPVMVMICILYYYTLEQKILSLQEIFTVISLVGVLQYPLNEMPKSITILIDSLVAATRIQNFLNTEEINKSYILHNQNSTLTEKFAIIIKNGYFSWVDPNVKSDFEETDLITIMDNPQSIPQMISLQSKNEDILRNINFRVRKGTFTAIIGEVASGKSSLLLSLLGEMKPNLAKHPKILINGSIGYIPQKPWTVSNSIRENILFGNEFNEQKYNKILEVTGLTMDLKVFPRRDLTELGEKGINISGGQNARISLARAIYQDTDILLLDDIFSALDAHVTENIMQNCILKYLKGKTILLATHKIDLLPYADNVLILEKGKIVAEGPYEKVKQLQVYQNIAMHENQKKEQEQIEQQKEKVVELEIGDEEDQDEEAKEEEEEENDSNKEEFLIKKQKITSCHNDDVDDDLKELDDISSISTQAEIKLMITSNSTGNIQMKNLFFDKTTSQKNYILTMVDNKTHQHKANNDNAYESLMLDEDRAIGAIDKKVYQDVVELFGGYSMFLLLFGLFAVWLGLSIYSNLWLSYWSDTTNPEHSMYYFKIYVILAIAPILTTVIRNIITYWRSLKLCKIIHDKMLTSILKAPIYSFFDRIPIGRILNRISKDLTDIDYEFSTVLQELLFNAFTIIGDLSVCVGLGSIWILIPSFIFVIIAYWLGNGFFKLNREILRLNRISRTPIITLFQETLNGLTTIRTYNAQEKYFKKHHKNQDEYAKNEILLAGLNGWITLWVCVASLGVVVPILILCISFSHELGINGGYTALLITYAVQTTNDMAYFVTDYPCFETYLVSIERCLAFGNIIPEKQTKVDSISKFNPSNQRNPHIEFISYKAKYRENLPLVLKDISLKIDHGEKIGIVGRTGSGKSTLFAAILRLLEHTSGNIFINSVDISKLPLNELRQNITIIPQDPTLFQDTIKKNLDPFNQYTDEEIWNTIKGVCPQPTFLDENGLETMINNGCNNISSGEKQLLCMIRAILQKNKIILIDEATSSVDIKAEKQIIETIKTKLSEFTILTIAHRLSTVINSSRILVMNKGRIEEFDTPENLLKNEESSFYKLWKNHEKGQQLLN